MTIIITFPFERMVKVRAPGLALTAYRETFLKRDAGDGWISGRKLVFAVTWFPKLRFLSDSLLFLAYSLAGRRRRCVILGVGNISRPRNFRQTSTSQREPFAPAGVGAHNKGTRCDGCARPARLANLETSYGILSIFASISIIFYNIFLQNICIIRTYAY